MGPVALLDLDPVARAHATASPPPPRGRAPREPDADRARKERPFRVARGDGAGHSAGLPRPVRLRNVPVRRNPVTSRTMERSSATALYLRERRGHGGPLGPELVERIRHGEPAALDLLSRGIRHPSIRSSGRSSRTPRRPRTSRSTSSGRSGGRPTGTTRRAAPPPRGSSRSPAPGPSTGSAPATAGRTGRLARRPQTSTSTRSTRPPLPTRSSPTASPRRRADGPDDALARPARGRRARVPQGASLTSRSRKGSGSRSGP